MYPHLDAFIELLFALAKRHTHPKLFHGRDMTVGVTAAISVAAEHEPGQAPLVAFHLYERITDEFENFEERMLHIQRLVHATRILMAGFSERIKREHGLDERHKPSLPALPIADLSTAEALVKKNVGYINRNLGGLCGNYQPLWEAASLTVRFQFKQHQTKIWQITQREELHDLAALLAIGMNCEDWKNEVMRRIRANNIWKKDDRAFDALLILLRHVAVESDDFVNEVLTTDRPCVMRLYA